MKRVAYAVACAILVAANVAVAAEPAQARLPWGACFWYYPPVTPCFCEEDIIQPDCHNDDQCDQYIYCPG